MFDVQGSSGRTQFLAQLEEQRQAKLELQRRNDAAIKIQRRIRGFVCRRRLRRDMRQLFDSTIPATVDADHLPHSVKALDAICLFLHLQNADDADRVRTLCRYLVLSCDSAEPKTSYIAAGVSARDRLPRWVACSTKVLLRCCEALSKLKMTVPADGKMATLYVHTLFTLTATSSWALLKTPQGEALRPSLNQVCVSICAELVKSGMLVTLSEFLKNSLLQTSSVVLKGETLSAVMLVSLRPLINKSFESSLLCDFIRFYMTIPALVHYLVRMAPQSVTALEKHGVFVLSMMEIVSYKCDSGVLKQLDPATALCLLANMIHLAALQRMALVEHLIDFTNVVTKIVDVCGGGQQRSGQQKTRAAHWHPILGWFPVAIDKRMQCAMPQVTGQLRLLWSAAMVQCLFGELVAAAEAQQRQGTGKDATGSAANAAAAGSSKAKEFAVPVKALMQKLLAKPLVQSLAAAAGGSGAASRRAQQRLGSADATVTALVCSLYSAALAAFTQLRTDILSGLCRDDFLLPKLWQYIRTLGAGDGLQPFLDALRDNPAATNPEFHILSLFADTAATLIAILDENEMYEQRKPFSLDDLSRIARFSNLFVYRALWNDIICAKEAHGHSLLSSMHNLIMVLHSRDCRRKFTPGDKFWIAGEGKLLVELHKGNPKAQMLMQKIPHVLAHKERVRLLRTYIESDKSALGITSAHHSDLFDDMFGDHLGPSGGPGGGPPPLVTVRRNHLAEDGYRQLGLLDTATLKGTIRVKFVNEQGLDEAGIDQHGVFKEFLEETIKKIFDPSLSLFKETSEGRLYPSPTSDVHDNHLQLFDFVGRILAKAVYEGIVVEVPFAHFFLSNLLGRRFSPLDELPSLDMDLYKNLVYIKRCDVTDLELTLSYDEDRLGAVVTHDLVPGGRTVPVTNENKIMYIHRVAHFRMVEQIGEQVRAFVTGFRAIVSAHWLAMFSPTELQMLISGASSDVDLADLKRHTHYYGGFHSQHRVIVWLWHILEHDFKADERAAFLKFVTSCSKPPLLGFAHLEPPFSIRCVDVADDQDQGDTIGSVIRGFLSIRTAGGGAGGGGGGNAPSLSRANRAASEAAHGSSSASARLPTSSTCFNLLKLPNYNKKSILKEKLRYAIHSGTGFELS